MEQAEEQFKANIHVAAREYLQYIAEQVHLNQPEFIDQLAGMFVDAASVEMDTLMVDVKEAVDQAVARYKAYNGFTEEE